MTTPPGGIPGGDRVDTPHHQTINAARSHAATTLLQAWRANVRRHLPAAVCDHLAKSGFPALAAELLRLRGDLP